MPDPGGPRPEPTVTELSQAAFDRLSAEYEDLTTRGRVELATTIERARELGDLSENADYHAAKDDQGRMEARIRQMKAILDQAVIIEASAAPEGVVVSGSVVSLRYAGDTDVEKYLVGSIEERREGLIVISPASPLGSVLLGRNVGNQVEYEAPGGTMKVEIVELD